MAARLLNFFPTFPHNRVNISLTKYVSLSQSFVSQVGKNIHKHDKISALHARALFMSAMVATARRTHCALYTSTTNTRHRVALVLLQRTTTAIMPSVFRLCLICSDYSNVKCNGRWPRPPCKSAPWSLICFIVFVPLSKGVLLTLSQSGKIELSKEREGALWVRNVFNANIASFLKLCFVL